MKCNCQWEVWLVLISLFDALVVFASFQIEKTTKIETTAKIFKDVKLKARKCNCLIFSPVQRWAKCQNHLNPVAAVT